MLLKDRVAIITGGAMGIGKGIALKFSDEGCSVVIADIAEDEGMKTAKEISNKGGKAEFIKCNILDNSQIQAAVAKAIEKFGKIDILINNAGSILGSDKGKIEDVSEEDWDKILPLNLKSQFLFSKAVVPHLKKNKYGKIVNISSMGAVNPSAPVMHYHAAKAGVIGLTLNLAMEIAQYNVTVNAIAPGPIRTPFWNPLVAGVPDPDIIFNAVAKSVPMQRVGTPEDIAGAALFFASDLSAYVTGQILCVAGGQPLLPMMGPHNE
ncbi:MAG: SDR family NAD(P)-dependent oxidoreductase [Dehalococcoidia bacterium]